MKFRLTASKVVQREIIYPMTILLKKFLLVAERAFVKKAWKKNAMLIWQNPQPKYIKNLKIIIDNY